MRSRTQRIAALSVLSASLLAAAPQSAPPAAGTLDYYLTQSQQLFDKARYRDSIAAAKEALRLKPDAEAAFNNIAVAELQLRNFDEALRNIHEALRIDPADQLAKNNLAWIEKEQAGIPARGWPGGTPEYFLDLSLWQYNGGRYQLCIDAAREALKLRPLMAAAWNNIAAASEALKLYDQAIDAARQALAIEPGFQLATNNLNSALHAKAAR